MKKVNLSISMGFMKPVQNFFKKYTALLPSIGIVIVAVLLFFPMMLVGKGVTKKMEASVRDGKKVSSLSGNVPSKDAPEQIKTYMDQLEEEKKTIVDLMTQSSQRLLISYDVFPPKSTSSQLYMDFGNNYRAAIESLVQGMKAQDAPSKLEIQEKTGGKARSRTTRPNRKTTATDPMVDALCLTRSQEISVYATPSLFTWYAFWEDYEFFGEDKALEDCWDSQVAYWVYADIVDTINKMNAGSQSVSSSPVKRLIDISFSGSTSGGGDTRRNMATRGGTMGRMGSAVRDIPNYIVYPDAVSSTSGRPSMSGMSSTSVTLTSNFVSSSPTARKGDEDIDVVHFGFSVLVDNRLATAFTKELCSEKSHLFKTGFKSNGAEQTFRHNQITILQSDISVVDKQSEEHALYRYGKGAVMRLDLVCEYQFARKGYDSIKPAPITLRLGQSDSGTTETQKRTAPRGVNM
ncbi:MAG: hypothetical protein ACYSUT_05035 [Planctomycetota bacterium]|jgi:hypothetical protein